MSCGVGHRCGLDPMLLWLWRRLEAAAPIQTLAWEPPYATRVVLKRPKKKRILNVCEREIRIGSDSCTKLPCGDIQVTVPVLALKELISEPDR